MSKNKKLSKGTIFGIIVCIVVIGAFLYSTYVSDQFTMKDAITVAEDYAPDNTVMVGTDEDRKAFEITFANDDHSRFYEFEVNKARQGISQIELSTNNEQGGRIINISSEQAKEIIEERFNHLKEVQVNLDFDDGFSIYELSFKSAKFYGEAEINPENGHIMKMTISYLRKATPSDGDFNFEKAFLNDDASQNSPENKQPADQNVQQPQNGPNSPAKTAITEDQAKQMVLDRVPGCNIVKFHSEIEDGIAVYDGTALKDQYEYDFEIDKETGAFIQWKKEIAD